MSPSSNASRSRTRETNWLRSETVQARKVRSIDSFSPNSRIWFVMLKNNQFVVRTLLRENAPLKVGITKLWRMKTEPNISILQRSVSRPPSAHSTSTTATVWLLVNYNVITRPMNTIKFFWFSQVTQHPRITTRFLLSWTPRSVRRLLTSERRRSAVGRMWTRRWETSQTLTWLLNQFEILVQSQQWDQSWCGLREKNLSLDGSTRSPFIRIRKKI